MKAIPKQVRGAVGASIAIENTSAKDAKCLGFFPQQYIYTVLPYSDPKCHTYQQVCNGQKLLLNADPDYGLPYGAIPRLLKACITSQAVKTKSRTLQLPRITQFCKLLNYSATGAKIAAIRKQALALFSTRILLKSASADVIAIKENYTLIDGCKLWAAHTKTQKDWLSEIHLSEAYYTQCKRAMPVDFRGLRELARSPIAMDVYIWLTYRLPYITSDVLVSHAALKHQFGFGYCNDKDGKFRFKQKMKEALRLAQMIYTDANIEWDKQGVLLKRSEKHVKHAAQVIHKKCR